jgi:hypothetical protein
MMYNQILEQRSGGATESRTAVSSGEENFLSTFRAMNEQEQPPIRITESDISEANQLSLSCPICGSAVENHLDTVDLVPVVCDKCGTLYHRACWERSGNKCAVLGCGSAKFHVHGRDTKPVLRVKYTDLPAPSANGRTSTSARNRKLKDEQRRQVQRISLFERFWRWLLDQIKINP